MEIKDILDLGKKVDVRTTNHGHTTCVTLYHQGKAHAKKVMEQRNHGVSLPAQILKKMAGIEAVTDLQKMNACCYARLVYERVMALNPKERTSDNISATIEKLNKQLKGRPLTYFLTEGYAEPSDPAVHTVLGAKGYISYAQSIKDKIWTSFGYKQAEKPEEKQ